MNELINAVCFIIDNSYISFQDSIFRQIIGIPMGTNCAPHLANIYLHKFEYCYLMKLIQNGQLDVAKKSQMYLGTKEIVLQLTMIIYSQNMQLIYIQGK